MVFKEIVQRGRGCRNPYFIGILSAIRAILQSTEWELQVAILILLESFLQSGLLAISGSRQLGRNPYFIGILSAITYS